MNVFVDREDADEARKYQGEEQVLDVRRQADVLVGRRNSIRSFVVGE